MFVLDVMKYAPSVSVLFMRMRHTDERADVCVDTQPKNRMSLAMAVGSSEA